MLVTEDELALFRQTLEDLWETMTVADFKRLHQKLVDGLITLETGFKRRFPAEWAAWELEFYGDEAAGQTRLQ